MSQDNKTKTGIWAVFAKLGTKMFSFLGKAFKLSKIGFAAASFAGYAALYSWKFALLLMISVGFHESGHVWAMKRMGIKTKGFYFIPFIGGAAIAEEQYRTYGENAYISIMGPIWGMAMSFGAALLYWTTGSPLWAAAGAWMAMINLFNLLPVTPLDGGQLMRTIAFSINKTLGAWFLAGSLLLAGFIMFKLHIGLFVLILAVGSIELFFELRNRILLHKVLRGEVVSWALPSYMIDDDGNIKAYPKDMNKKQMAYTAASYLGTLAGLIAILFALRDVPGADLAANFLQ